MLNIGVGYSCSPPPKKPVKKAAPERDYPVTDVIERAFKDVQLSLSFKDRGGLAVDAGVNASRTLTSAFCHFGFKGPQVCFNNFSQDVLNNVQSVVREHLEARQSENPPKELFFSEFPSTYCDSFQIRNLENQRVPYSAEHERRVYVFYPYSPLDMERIRTRLQVDELTNLEALRTYYLMNYTKLVLETLKEDEMAPVVRKMLGVAAHTLEGCYHDWLLKDDRAEARKQYGY